MPEGIKNEDLFDKILALKNSKNLSDQIKFIDQLILLFENGVMSPREAVDYLHSIINSSFDFSVRKKAALILAEYFTPESQMFFDVLNQFAESEQTAIANEISNWIHSANKDRKIFTQTLHNDNLFYKNSNIPYVLRKKVFLHYMPFMTDNNFQIKLALFFDILKQFSHTEQADIIKELTSWKDSSDSFKVNTIKKILIQIAYPDYVKHLTSIVQHSEFNFEYKKQAFWAFIQYIIYIRKPILKDIKFFSDEMISLLKEFSEDEQNLIVAEFNEFEDAPMFTTYILEASKTLNDADENKGLSFSVRKYIFIRTLADTQSRLHPHTIVRKLALFSDTEQSVIVQELISWKSFDSGTAENQFIRDFSRMTFVEFSNELLPISTIKLVLESPLRPVIDTTLRFFDVIDLSKEDVDNDSQTILELAREKNQDQVVDLLLKHGIK